MLNCIITTPEGFHQSSVDIIAMRTGYINSLFIRLDLVVPPYAYSPHNSSIYESRQSVLDAHAAERFVNVLHVNFSKHSLLFHISTTRVETIQTSRINSDG